MTNRKGANDYIVLVVRICPSTLRSLLSIHSRISDAACWAVVFHFVSISIFEKFDYAPGKFQKHCRGGEYIVELIRGFLGTE